MKVTVTINDALLSKLDEYVIEHGFNTRSECIQSVLRPVIFKNEKPSKIKEDFNRKIQESEAVIEEVTKRAKEVKARAIVSPFAICPRHGGFFSTCGCSSV